MINSYSQNRFTGSDHSQGDTLVWFVLRLSDRTSKSVRTQIILHLDGPTVKRRRSRLRQSLVRHNQSEASAKDCRPYPRFSNSKRSTRTHMCLKTLQRGQAHNARFLVANTKDHYVTQLKFTCLPTNVQVMFSMKSSC